MLVILHPLHTLLTHHYVSIDIKVSKTREVKRNIYNFLIIKMFLKEKIQHYMNKTLLSPSDDV